MAGLYALSKGLSVKLLQLSSASRPVEASKPPIRK